MKRIEFIAPVKSMRGNFGSKQALVYAPNNNRAYDSYDDQLNPALNYEPRLIGAKGKRNYFCVKAKSSVRLTSSAKTSMSLLGALGSMYGALVRDKMSNVYINAKGVYDDNVAAGYTGTMREFYSKRIMDGLRNKDATIVVTSANHQVSIDNPWVSTLNIVNLQVPNAIFAKFWNVLAVNGISFKVGGTDAVAHTGDSFNDIISGMPERFNLANLNANGSGDILSDSMYLIDNNGKHVFIMDTIVANFDYQLTSVAP